MNIFINMMAWVAGLVVKNIYLIVAVGVLGIAYAIKKWKYPGSGR